MREITTQFASLPAGIWVVLGLLIAVMIGLRVRRNKQTIPRATIATFAGVGFFLFLWLGMGWFFGHFRSSGPALLTLFGLALVLCFVYAFAEDWPVDWIHDRLRRADYEGALSRANRMLPWWPDKATVRYMRGTTLLFAGRPQEAESDLRESLLRTKDARKKAIAQSNLGYALLDQERFREAGESFEKSIEIYTGSGSASNGLAEVLLREDQRPFEALSKAGAAIERKQRSGLTDRHMLAYMWANSARALAKLGREDEASAALRNAENECAGVDFVPGFAGAHWRIGLALEAMDRKAEAREHFRRASEADPEGNYGKRAAQAMQGLES